MEVSTGDTLIFCREKEEELGPGQQMLDFMRNFPISKLRSIKTIKLTTGIPGSDDNDNFLTFLEPASKLVEIRRKCPQSLRVEYILPNWRYTRVLDQPDDQQKLHVDRFLYIADMIYFAIYGSWPNSAHYSPKRRVELHGGSDFMKLQDWTGAPLFGWSKFRFMPITDGTVLRGEDFISEELYNTHGLRDIHGRYAELIEWAEYMTKDGVRPCF